MQLLDNRHSCCVGSAAVRFPVKPASGCGGGTSVLPARGCVVSRSSVAPAGLACDPSGPAQVPHPRTTARLRRVGTAQGCGPPSPSVVIRPWGLLTSSEAALQPRVSFAIHWTPAFGPPRCGPCWPTLGGTPEDTGSQILPHPRKVTTPQSSACCSVILQGHGRGRSLSPRPWHYS